MTTTVYNSKDIKYIWSTSDDDGLTSMTFLSEDDIIYAITCEYNDDNADMEDKYYKSKDTDNEELWNQLIIDNLENFDKYFKEVTDEEDIDYIKNKETIYSAFVYETEHNLSHDLLRSMIIALYTNITAKMDIADDVLNSIFTDVIDMFSDGNELVPPSEDSLAYIRKYGKESLFETPLLQYRRSQYRNLVLRIITLIKDNHA
jgi:hypothetical protein